MRGLPSRAFFLTPMLLLGLVSACSSSSDPSDSYGSGAAANSGGSGNTYVPPSCDQGCQDYLVSWGVTDTIWFLWTQRLVGIPVGTHDISGSCPLGGDVQITGTNDVSSDEVTNSFDLVFEFTGCENAGEVYDLTFTGSVTMEGSYVAYTDVAAITYSSDELEVSGEVHYYDDPPIDESCELNFAQDGGGEAFTMAGRRCGRQFNESSLDVAGTGGSSGSGSGGSGNTGNTGGGSCDCLCPDDSVCDPSEPNACGVDENNIPEVCGCPAACP